MYDIELVDKIRLLRVLLHSSAKGFWACLGDFHPDMTIRPVTWVYLYNLILKRRDILLSFAPQSNHNYYWGNLTLQRRDVKHANVGRD